MKRCSRCHETGHVRTTCEARERRKLMQGLADHVASQPVVSPLASRIERGEDDVEIRCACGSEAALYRGCPCGAVAGALCPSCVTRESLRALRAEADAHELACPRSQDLPFDPWAVTPLRMTPLSTARPLALPADRERVRHTENRTRAAILDVLAKGELAAGEISARIGCRPPMLSYHLAALRAARAVVMRKERGFRFYALAKAS